MEFREASGPGIVPEPRPFASWAIIRVYLEREICAVWVPDVNFKLASDYQPCGDQPQAIAQLVRGVEGGEKHQVLLGVTGSGKTFTAAKIIEHVNLPTIVLAHNKTLAAQLFHEFKGFFPQNAVEYFVSYYDYYQPEAYFPA